MNLTSMSSEIGVVSDSLIAGLNASIKGSAFLCWKSSEQSFRIKRAAFLPASWERANERFAAEENGMRKGSSWKWNAAAVESVFTVDESAYDFIAHKYLDYELLIRKLPAEYQ